MGDPLLHSPLVEVDHHQVRGTNARDEEEVLVGPDPNEDPPSLMGIGEARCVMPLIRGDVVGLKEGLIGVCDDATDPRFEGGSSLCVARVPTEHEQCNQSDASPGPSETH